ncbi:MAG: ATP-binding protein, partial [Candidatus Rokubacteria bacterium]|nr:ATP-binding protein [Candidatus Rokubacteria bacterium]
MLRQKLADGLSSPPPPLTRRELRLPAVPGKALAVVGVRRSGKTTFLWQCLA